MFAYHFRLVSVVEGPIVIDFSDIDKVIPLFSCLYEREIFRGIAVKGGLSHMTMWMKNTFEYEIKVKFSLGKIIKFFKDWSTIKQ